MCELSLVLVYFICIKIITLKNFEAPQAQRPWCMCTTCTMVNPALQEWLNSWSWLGMVYCACLLMTSHITMCCDWAFVCRLILYFYVFFLFFLFFLFVYLAYDFCINNSIVGSQLSNRKCELYFRHQRSSNIVSDNTVESDTIDNLSMHSCWNV